MNPLDFTPDDFNAYLAEMYPDGGGNAGFLRQQYREKNNVTSMLPDGGLADGRQSVAGGFASKDAGATGRDAMRSLRPAIWNGIRGLLQGGGEAVQAPLDAYRGLLSPDEMTGAAMGTAGMAMGGGMAASGRGLLDYDPNTVNIFAGRKAKTADHAAADRAEIMLANGADRADVWRETGWMRGVDGQMRFEIDDSRSVMRSDVANLLSNGELGENIRTDLNGAMLHQDLLGGSRRGQEIPVAYDDLGEGFVNATRSDGVYGSYNSKTGDIEIGSPNNIDGRAVLLHEAQHAVQGREGFARGSSPEREESAIYKARNDRSSELARQMDLIYSEEGLHGYGATHPRLTPIRSELDSILGIIPDAKKAAYNNYNNSAGEVEARNASLRAAMSAERRLETPPWQTQDVPDAAQTVDFGGDTMYSTPPATLPTPRNDAEAMAKQVLEMRAAGNAGDVTDDMMAMADDPYMFNNTPLDMSAEARMGRAGDMNVFHGGDSGIVQIDPDAASGKDYDTGGWTTSDRYNANRYAGSRTDGMKSDPDDLGSVYPLSLDTSNYGSTNFYGSNWGDAPPRAYMEVGDVRRPISELRENWQSWPSTHEAARAARGMGLGGINIKNVKDYGDQFPHKDHRGMGSEVSNTVVVSDPTTARSIFARNDPAFKHLRNLSAGVAGVGLLSQADQRQQSRGLLE